MAQPSKKDGVQVVADNRKARHHWSVVETYECGIVLTGSEVKAMREGTVNLSDSYALPEKDEVWLYNLHIGPYKAAAGLGHAPLRKRKLLLKRGEIDKLVGKVAEKGYSLVPLRLFFKNGWAKVDLALARGKTHEDQREDIKERESRREMERAVRRR